MVILDKNKRYVVIVNEKKKARDDINYHRNRFIDIGLNLSNFRVDFPNSLREMGKKPIADVYELAQNQTVNKSNNTLHISPEFRNDALHIGKLNNCQGILCKDLPSLCKCQSKKAAA